MSDIKDALVHSEQNAIAAINATEQTCDFPVAVLPANMRIHNLEEHQELRNQFRGKLSTHLIKDFAAYTNRQPAGACFVDSLEMQATAFFDIGNMQRPGHCRHRACICLKDTAAYRELINIDGSRITQQQLAEFMEDWGANITALDVNKIPMDIKSAIHAVRNIDIKASVQAEHGLASFSTSKSSIEQINASGKDNNPLPCFIEFNTIPFIGISSYKFVMRISLVISGKEKPEFYARIIKLDELKEEMNGDFFELIKKDVDKKIKLYTGFFNTDF